VSLEVARAYYDFSVRYGDILFDPAAVDVSQTHFGGINEEVRIEAAVPVSADCAPGVLWTRVVKAHLGLLVHLIDLSSQDSALWDAPKLAGADVVGTTLAVERAGGSAPQFFFASPESSPALQPLQAEFDGRHDLVSLPPFRTWAFVWARPS
jgi:hypothetical protein